MKQEFDKQLDSLLRGTRGAGEVRLAAGATEHLSPDELSAYAENALPQAARSLYTAHLADCSDCRRIVTAVALASGAEVAREARPAGVAAVSGAASKSSWGARLAALFSPRVLAYAAPVLAVAIIGAVALVVLRGRQGLEAPNVAQRSDEEVARPGSITQPAPAADTSASPTAANMDAHAPEAHSGPVAGTLGVNAARTEAAANAPAPVKVTTQEEEEKAEAAKDSVRELADADEAAAASSAPKPATAAAAPPPAYSTQPAASAPAAPPSAGARADAREAGDKQESRQQRSATNVARAAERGEDARRDAPEPERGRAMDRHARDDRRLYGDKSKSDGNVPSETEGLAARKRSGDPARGGGGAASETRSVAGHQFRRQGGAWVDVSYRSSMSTVNVRRGSESFRSLVADIPEVGRAAEQLPGTIIIVARGRAYRIN